MICQDCALTHGKHILEEGQAKLLEFETMNLRLDLPKLLPKAINWAERKQREILETGRPLSQEEIAIARGVGVVNPEKIRIKIVDRLPFPEDPELAAAAQQTGMLGPDMTGLTLFYGIFICQHDSGNRHLIAHECRHVQQYEERGSISHFLQEYLFQILSAGYDNSQLERDARMAAARFL